MVFSGKSPSITLNNGLSIPAFGLGTLHSVDDQGVNAVKYAIDAGYRHFDTAYLYKNEAQVGQAIREKIAEGVIKREDVFVTTKLWGTFFDETKVEYACKKSLSNLGLDYIDLYLIHFPVGINYVDDDQLFPKNKKGGIDTNENDYIYTWLMMEKLVHKGLVKSIGISNFNIQQMQRLLKHSNIKPAVNQIECSPHVLPLDTIKFCKDNNIIVTAYTPLGRPDPVARTPDYMFDEKVEKIAEKYNKTVAIVVLRFLYEVGTIPLPKSSNKSRIEENINIFDFALDKKDFDILKGYAKTPISFLVDGFFETLESNNGFIKQHKFYPFNNFN